jgi:hypothetical protein
MATKKPARKPTEIRIREKDDEEFFRNQKDPYVLPPELNMTIKDGFRFGVGFILAMIVFYVIAGLALILLLKVGGGVNIG